MSNGQVEDVNKIIKENLEKKLKIYKEVWINELPKFISAYRTTNGTVIGETPFAMAFGVKEVIRAEVGSYTTTRGSNQRLSRLEIRSLRKFWSKSQG